MQSEPTRFYSDGLRLSADFHWPDANDSERPQPMVIACSGFTGLRHIHPARFARYLTGRGLACFGFDYRGFADSEGPPRRVLLEEQVRDILHAAAFVASDERVDPAQIVLLGWGMAGGLVLDAARRLPGVIGVVAANGFYDGRRVQLAHRGEDGLSAFVERVDTERRERSRTGQIKLADPFDIYPLDPQSRRYVDSVLRKTEGYVVDGYSFELADSLLRWQPLAYADTMHTPLLIAHGDRNALHPIDEAQTLFDRYAGPRELYWIKGGGHTEFMHDDDPRFQALAARIVEWITARLNQARGD